MHLATKVFFLVCIPIRLLLVYIAKNYNQQIFAIPALIGAGMWMYAYLFGIRPNGIYRKAWWNEFRVIHALFYIGYATYTIKMKPFAWIMLLLDVLFGIGLVLWHNDL